MLSPLRFASSWTFSFIRYMERRNIRLMARNGHCCIACDTTSAARAEQRLYCIITALVSSDVHICQVSRNLS